MRIHVTTVGEASPAYVNQIRLLLHSFRRRSGFVGSAPFTVIFNGSGPGAAVEQELGGRFGACVRVMPRISFHCPTANRFNYLYAVSEDYDFLVNFDCDIVVLRTIEGLFEGLDAGQLGFAGTPATNYLVWNSAAMLRKYARMTPWEVRALYGDILHHFRPNYPQLEGGFRRAPFPYFCGGVYVMTRSTVERIREDVVRNCHELSLYGRFGLGGRVVFELNRRLVRLIPRTPFTLGMHYQRIYSEMLGLAMALLKHRVAMSVLDYRYNQYLKTPPAEGPARVLHYTKRAYPLPREELLSWRWVEAYKNATHRPEAGELAGVIQDYLAEYGA
ncbi:MAG: hypothetical protein AB1714_11070 [Acidobacteriota bacterium]